MKYKTKVRSLLKVVSGKFDINQLINKTISDQLGLSCNNTIYDNLKCFRDNYNSSKQFQHMML